jgi:hypothetical protein
MTPHERAAYTAMKSAPWMTEALTVDYTTEVLVARGMERASAEKLAQRVYDKHFKIYGA